MLKSEQELLPFEPKSDAYWEGYTAYLDGELFLCNPYPSYVESAPECDDWDAGYSDAQWDD